MKVILLGRYSSPDIFSGPEKVALNLFFNLNKKQLKSIFITYYFKELKISTITNRLFGKQLLNENPQVFRFGILQIIIFLLFNRPQIIHIITFERFQIPIIILTKILRIKIVYTVHGIFRDELKLRRLPRVKYLKDLVLEWLIFHLYDKIIFLSEKSRKIAEKYYKLNKNKITFIPNGISQKYFLEKANKTKESKLSVVFYNGITKNVERGLLELIDLLDKKELNFLKLYIIGNEKSIATKYLDISLIAPMDEDNLVVFLTDKDIFIMAATHSTFSLMALECMALGLIVVVSSEVGISEYIESGINGFVYQKSSPEQVINIIKKINEGKINTSQIIKNAKETCLELKWDNIANNYLYTYQKILDRK